MLCGKIFCCRRRKRVANLRRFPAHCVGVGITIDQVSRVFRRSPTAELGHALLDRLALHLKNSNHMKHLALLLLAGTFLSNPNSNVQTERTTSMKPTIIFVHGLWADGSCWSKVIPSLLEQGFNVISVQNPTTSL